MSVLGKEAFQIFLQSHTINTFSLHLLVLSFVYLLTFCVQNPPKSEKSLKQSNKLLKVQQTSKSQNRRKTTELQRKAHLEDDENRPPSPTLPHLPHSASPPLPSHLPSPFLSPDPLSTEDGTTDEEVTISVNTRENLFPEGEELHCLQYLEHVFRLMKLF